ncbi:MFS transporter [Actinoallomurus bryophytorum]|uniref:EmrB/QacA subfamily drug resistance transporter n=1 Tax=Actinoallomurus bryophytorum TaxID=1490222 RepID=A0A543BSQ1_9ACTN|nr:MFS transporter [Actinoallomurus bryophytorum]TQL87840.1 EmrB/QacA subfamily drug resistance transporter [Actinoallomurus bryophytorum]
MSETQTVAVPPARGAAQAVRRPRQGLSLLVIATAQLMVVLDATVTNVALPRIQEALRFSAANLSWVVNAYALAFGGLLLLGGRAGDLLGRRRMFVVGLLVFSAASLAGGFATSTGWLLAARAVQGAGGAIVAPAALSLIVTTFPEGRPRARAMGVYSAMSVAGGALGLVAGGLLVNYASWRWVLFVNVPFGVAAALAAPLVLAGAPRMAGRLDIPGALTGTAGVAALVYGLSGAATGPDGVSHWGDAKVVVSLAAGVVLLAAFGLVEARSRHALLPGRLLRDRARLGANLIMLGVGTVLFGVFFFLTLFAQEVWGYSAIRTGVAFLPLTGAVLAGSVVASTLLPRVGARPLLLAGTAGCAGGLFWLSLMTENAGYAGGLLGPILVTAAGLGLLFVPLPLVALAGVADSDSGVAASLLNATRQIGGAVGLAMLSTVAWTVTAGSTRAHGDHRHALVAGFDRAFAVAAGIAVLTLLVTIATIRKERR